MIKFKNTPEQIDLVKAMGSNDSTISAQASEAFAGLAGKVIMEVLNQLGTAPLIFEDVPFNEDENPTLPVDLFYGDGAKKFVIWSQDLAGGLATNRIQGASEIKLYTYNLTTAVSLGKKYVRRARMDVVAKAIDRMLNEILVKQEVNAWSVLLKAAAEATFDTGVGGVKNNIIRSATAGTFLPDDLSSLFTLQRRVYNSYAGGTPAGGRYGGLTDLFVSPEIMGQIRGFAYNPVNTKQATSGTTSITLPENAREAIWKAAGANELWGVSLHELNEFGVGYKYNKLFDAYDGGKTFTKADGTGGATFNGATSEIMLGFNLDGEGFYRPIQTVEGTGGSILVKPDDQFLERSGTIGWYASLDEGRLVTDSRKITGLIV